MNFHFPLILPLYAKVYSFSLGKFNSHNSVDDYFTVLET